MKVKIILIGFIVILFLSGCVEGNQNNLGIIENCLSVQEELTSFQFEGKLVLNGVDTYIIDDLNGRKSYLPGDKEDGFIYVLSDFLVDPSHTKLIYKEVKFQEQDDRLVYIDDSEKILFSNNDENEIQKIKSELDSYKIINWFDNDRLLISVTDDINGTILLFNPINNNSERIPPVINNIYNFDQITWYQISNPLPLYNNSISRVLYLSYTENNFEDMKFVLYDLENNQVLWSKKVNHPQIRPEWLSKEESIILAIKDSSSNDYEFYYVSENGEEKKLTDYSSFYEINIITGFSISPDESKIGFWLDSTNNGVLDSRFTILDLDSNETTNYCFIKAASNIIWSPSSNQVAFASKLNPLDEREYVIVLDLNSNSVVKIDDQVEPVGWLLDN